jgi:hypothetical protein
MRRDALGGSATGPPRHPHDAGTTMGAAPRRRLIQRSAWKWNSRKFVCRILHSAGPIGRESPYDPTSKL